jgi:hypothetical protein
MGSALLDQSSVGFFLLSLPVRSCPFGLFQARFLGRAMNGNAPHLVGGHHLVYEALSWGCFAVVCMWPMAEFGKPERFFGGYSHLGTACAKGPS